MSLSLIRKIENLFDLASNNPSEEESKAAINLARKLMLKYNVKPCHIGNFIKPINNFSYGNQSNGGYKGTNFSKYI